MSERFGKCNFCKGTGERVIRVPGTEKMEVIEMTDELKAALPAHGSIEFRTAVQQTVKLLTYTCPMCCGTAGFSGDAMAQNF